MLVGKEALRALTLGWRRRPKPVFQLRRLKAEEGEGLGHGHTTLCVAVDSSDPSSKSVPLSLTLSTSPGLAKHLGLILNSGFQPGRMHLPED